MPKKNANLISPPSQFLNCSKSRSLLGLVRGWTRRPRTHG
jgi:hypothetical protein